ncbi:hypothetical protein [Nocardiopsis sp. Huas11]|nr:hypothetical protein [Nocardiopsis sp. Huas11]
MSRPLQETHDSDNNSYRLYGRTTDGRKIYVAVRDTTWGTAHPIL